MSKLLQRAAKEKYELQQSAEEEDEEIESSSRMKDISLGKKKKGDKKSSAKAQKALVKEISNIIYLGHIPHGFYEKEMRAFFKQFGEVKRLKHFRSKKTNGSKGYAFLEFVDADTASTVAEAIDGYYLQDKRLVCHAVPLEKVHEGMFLTSKKRSLEKEDNKSEEGALRPKVSDKLRAERFVAAHNKKRQRLESLGMAFDLPSPALDSATNESEEA